MASIIGIDLGTTNSVVAVTEGKEPKVIVNAEGARMTPSVVAWDEKGDTLVGTVAKRQSVTNPENTIYSAKRFIGRRFDEIGSEGERVPYRLAAAKDGGVRFDVRGKQYAAPEISARVLQKLKQSAEAYLGEPVTQAVITVPAYFNDAQRQATKDAGKIAGLEVLRIINEPTAAALAYGLDSKKNETIAVYDFGGGTFDISILEVGDNVVEVVATNGDTHLGGDDVDTLVVDHLTAEFRKQTGIDVGSDKMVIQRLRDAAETAKIELSSKEETQINLPFLTADASGPKHLQTHLTRARLEQMIEPLVERTLAPMRAALADAKKEAKDIDEVVLVGGSTRIPMVQQRVTEFFGKSPHHGVNPDEVVALGAAIQGGVLGGSVKDVLLLDVTPLSLGVETLGGVMTTMIPRNTTIPAQKKETYTTASDNQATVDIHVLQGERATASDNRTLGRFHLENLGAAPRGTPQIEVTFDIDANGILSVTARDVATGRDQSITITANSGLDQKEVERMVADAREHEVADRERLDGVQQRNALEAAIYSAERLTAELGGSEPELDAKLAGARAALNSSETRTFIEAREALERVLQDRRAAAAAADSAPPESSRRPFDGDVIDAEFEETGS